MTYHQVSMLATEIWQSSVVTIYVIKTSMCFQLAKEESMLIMKGPHDDEVAWKGLR